MPLLAICSLNAASEPKRVLNVSILAATSSSVTFVSAAFLVMIFPMIMSSRIMR